MGEAIQKLGIALACIGGICFASIFIVVIANGSWPNFLEPVRSRFELIDDFVGGFAFIVELFLFVGPGLLIAAVGEKLKSAK